MQYQYITTLEEKEAAMPVRKTDQVYFVIGGKGKWFPTANAGTRFATELNYRRPNKAKRKSTKLSLGKSQQKMTPASGVSTTQIPLG